MISVACLSISSKLYGKEKELSLENLLSLACHGKFEKSAILELEKIIISLTLNFLGKETILEEV